MPETVEIEVLKPCPVCNSAYTAYVRHVMTIRTRRPIALYTCLECRSFWNPSGYREDDHILENDFKWNLSVADRNRQHAPALFSAIQKAGGQLDSVVEIGCGTGTMMGVLKERGAKTIGFDVNRFAIAYAREQGHDARDELWTLETPLPPVTLFLSVSVLEHIDQPRPLLRDLCQAAKKHGASLYVSVPFVNEVQWPYILDPDPKKQGTPFFDNDVHVTHFSHEGMTRLLREFGARTVTICGGGIWRGALAVF